MQKTTTGLIQSTVRFFAFHVWLKDFVRHLRIQMSAPDSKTASHRHCYPYVSAHTLPAILRWTLDIGHMLLSKLPVFYHTFLLASFLFYLTCCHCKPITLDINLLWSKVLLLQWGYFKYFNPICVQHKLISLHYQRHMYWRGYKRGNPPWYQQVLIFP